MTNNDIFEVADSVIRLIGSGGFQKGTFDDVAVATGQDPRLTSEAAFFLRDNELLSFQTDWGKNLCLAPKLSGRAMYLHHSGESVKSLFQQAAPNVSTTVHGGTVNQQIGNHNSQTITVDIAPEQVLALVGALREAQLDDAADVVEAETMGGAEPGGIRNALSKIGPTISAAGGLGSVTSAIIALLA